LEVVSQSRSRREEKEEKSSRLTASDKGVDLRSLTREQRAAKRREMMQKRIKPPPTQASSNQPTLQQLGFTSKKFAIQDKAARDFLTLGDDRDLLNAFASDKSTKHGCWRAHFPLVLDSGTNQARAFVGYIFITTFACAFKASEKAIYDRVVTYNRFEISPGVGINFDTVLSSADKQLGEFFLSNYSNLRHLLEQNADAYGYEGELFVSVGFNVEQEMNDPIEGHSWDAAYLACLNLFPGDIILTGSPYIPPGDLELKTKLAVDRGKKIVIFGVEDDDVDLLMQTTGGVFLDSIDSYSSTAIVTGKLCL